MGIDAIIEVKRKDGTYEEIECRGGGRYYDETYARGNWNLICSCIMESFADEDILEVYYYSDHSNGRGHPITIDRVLEISRFYMENGNRPYYYKDSKNDQ